MRSNGFDLDQLRAFVAVADRLNFRQAAEDIHLSPPALSRRIERLEAQLGARLFERSSRAVRLTRTGEAFQQRVRNILEDLEAAVLGIDELVSGQGGRVTVACVPSVALRLLPAAIQAFQRELPRVQVRVQDDAMQVIALSVLSGEADFAIGFAAGEELPGLQVETLLSDPYVLAVPREHALARRKRLRWQELKDWPLVGLMRGGGNRQLLERHLDDIALPLRPQYEAAHVAALLGLVEAGLGVGVVPSLALPADHPRLQAVALTEPALSRELALITPRARRLGPVAHKLLEQLRQQVGSGQAGKA